MFLLGQHLGQFRVWFSSGVSCEACHITYTSSDGKALYEIISNLRERGQYRLENVLVSKGKGDSGSSKAKQVETHLPHLVRETDHVACCVVLSP